jgi:hypothetical protein
VALAMASSFLRFLYYANDALQSIRILSMKMLLPDKTQHSQETNFHAPGGIGTPILGKRAAADRTATRIRGRQISINVYLTHTLNNAEHM